MSVKIVTNNVPRDVLMDGMGMTEDERAQFDYIDWAAVERGDAGCEFFRFKGQLYDLGDMEAGYGSPNPDWMKGWDNYISDSFFSGIVIKFPKDEFNPEERDWERVIVGTYYVKD